MKWGGDFGSEAYKVPFNGNKISLPNGAVLEPDVKISSRENELKVIEYWRKP
jgi:hypothetical protein